MRIFWLRYQSLEPIFVSFCGLSSAILKIAHAAWAKPKILKVSKIKSGLENEENNDEFTRNRLSAEPKSSLIRKREKERKRARTQSKDPREDINLSDNETKMDVNDFFKKPYKSKHYKKKI